MAKTDTSSRKAGNWNRVTLLALVGAFAVSGCTSARLNPPAEQPSSLQPAPLPPVPSNQLPPPTGPVAPVAAVDTTAPSGDLQPSLDPPSASTPTTDVASLSDNAQPVTQGALVGAWTVSVGGGACQIFMSTTKWSGGSRAAVKGCAGTDVSDVQAWRLAGKQVVLVDATGSNAATLYRSSDSRFDGSTAKGTAISFSR